MKKKWILPAALFILCGMAVTLFSLKRTEATVTDVRFTEEVVVEDGMAGEVSRGIPFTIAKDGRYRIMTDWDVQKPGVLTGFAVRTQAGKIVFCVTGESVEAESEELELASGAYTAEYYFFTKEEQLIALTEEAGAIFYGEDASNYDYAEEGVYETAYHFEIKSSGINTNSMGRLAGFLAGAAVALIIAAVFLKFIKTDKSSTARYDERQLRARGDGFKYGFFTGLIYQSVLCLLHIADVKIPAEESVQLFLGILLSAFVYAVYCIRKEAYVSLNESAARFRNMFAVLAVVNIGLGAGSCFRKTIVENGMLTYHSLNLLCGIFVLLIAVLLHIQIKRTEYEE